jgi:hypothetical protein
VNAEQVRVAIIEEIAAVLFDLSGDEDESLSPEEQLVVGEALITAAEIVVDALGIEVVDVDAEKGVAHLTFAVGVDGSGA